MIAHKLVKYFPMNIRTRITLDQALLREAVEYATADHRTFSELVSTALKERMHRFPKREKPDDSGRIEALEISITKMLEAIKELRAGQTMQDKRYYRSCK